MGERSGRKNTGPRMVSRVRDSPNTGLLFLIRAKRTKGWGKEQGRGVCKKGEKQDVTTLKIKNIERNIRRSAPCSHRLSSMKTKLELKG